MPLFKKTPAFQLTGLAAHPEGLYDGAFIVAWARWWNHEIATRRELGLAGYRPFTNDDLVQLRAAVQPENQKVFEAVASTVSVPGRQSTAALGLSYALALVIDAGAAQVRGPEEESLVRQQAPPFTADDVNELSRHYNEEGAAHEYELWSPFWMAASTVFSSGVGKKLIDSATAVYYDQVDRWGAAEGFSLRRGIGPVDYSIIAFNENAGLQSFIELLLDWGGRLRLGERVLANGESWDDYRFGDGDDFIDHLYAEAFERFESRAAENAPVEEPVEQACIYAAAWLADGKNEREKLAASTAAVRGYLWRTSGQQNLHFLEPKLGQAIEASRTVGDNRSPDEPRSLTLYFAASQCMADGVQTRLGSIGGLLQGARSYERAFYDTLHDFADIDLVIDEATRRGAFQFGVCLADVEAVMNRP